MSYYNIIPFISHYIKFVITTFSLPPSPPLYLRLHFPQSPFPLPSPTSIVLPNRGWGTPGAAQRVSAETGRQTISGEP